jgi:hypothetical protein
MTLAVWLALGRDFIYSGASKPDTEIDRSPP